MLTSVAEADDRSAGKLSPMRAAAFSPIGKVYSLGELSIDGRRINGEQMIWGAKSLVEVAIGEARSTSSMVQPESIDGQLVNTDSRDRPISERPKTIKTPPNLVEKLAVRLTVRRKTEPKPGRPLPVGTLVRFVLQNPLIGRFNSPEVTVPTNDYGVAIATFTAGPKKGKSKVTATVAGQTGPSWEGQIIVGKAGGLHNKLLLGAAVAAAVIVLVVRRKKPLKQEPPPVIP